MLLSTAYCPPISWFALVAKDFNILNKELKSSTVYIEAYESYQKQSYRNRCYIYSSQGREALYVPVIKKTGQVITEIEIDYSMDWITKTKRAIVSAYMHSAFFEYYKDEFFAIFDRRHKYLWTLNLELINFFCSKLNLLVDIKFTDSFVLNSEYREDYRFSISPKKEDSILSDLQVEKPYFQVFAQKHGFISNLSIMDLLFNEGNNSIFFLKKLV